MSPRDIAAAGSHQCGQTVEPKYNRPMDEEVLQSTAHREVVRVGDTVRRPVHAWSPSVHALLVHLESVAFPYSPRFLGFDDEGREVLSYTEGDSGAAGWWKVLGDDGLKAFARLLHEYHDAVAGFRPDESSWSTGLRDVAPNEIVCHGDFGPWNVIWRDFEPVGLIDWDYARPGSPSFDVAYALEYVAPFRSDELCISWMHHPAVPDRAARVRAFIDAYGADPSADWANAVIEVQQDGLDLVRKLAESGAEPQATWARDGYLERLEDQLQWSRNNRHLF